MIGKHQLTKPDRRKCKLHTAHIARRGARHERVGAQCHRRRTRKMQLGLLQRPHEARGPIVANDQRLGAARVVSLQQRVCERERRRTSLKEVGAHQAAGEQRVREKGFACCLTRSEFDRWDSEEAQRR
jgi:hypothetical protein